MLLWLMLDRWITPIIFASDNGGCYQAGGKNGDLRGTKGSLWEGGVKVDSFIYSPLLDSNVQGSKYNGIMHVSDWFPTILELARISNYQPGHENKLDGVSQVLAMTNQVKSNPRQFLLYNMYSNVEEITTSNVALAIRDSRYKVIHAYTNNPAAQWYKFTEPLDDDMDMSSRSCPQQVAMVGGYQQFLFDLVSDPNETRNLYNNPDYAEQKEALYEQLAIHMTQTRKDIASLTANEKAAPSWEQFGFTIGPWTGDAEDAKYASVGKSYPQRCSATDSIFME